MNKAQTRLLLEMEFEFYKRGFSAVYDWEELLASLGYKRNANIALLDDSGLKRLNLKLRSALRSNLLTTQP